MSRISALIFKSFNRKQHLYVLAGLLLAVSSSLTWADEPRNTISLRAHVGEVFADSYEDPFDEADGSTVHFSGSYLYNITPWFSLGAGYLGAENKDYETFFDSDNISYQAFAVIAEGRIVLSERHRNFFYGRLNGLRYDYKIRQAFYVGNNGRGGGSGYVSFSDKGTSIGAAAGWSIVSHNGVGFEVGYEFLQLGSEIDVRTITFGLSYSF